MTVPDPAGLPVTVDELDDVETPEWDATVAEHGNPLDPENTDD